MSLPERMNFGIFMAPFHHMNDNPTLAIERDLEIIQWLDHLGFDQAWIGEHHSVGWETIASPEIFIGVAAERTKHIKLGTGVVSLPYHHPLMVANRMILLDHLTKGRVLLGVGPGALQTDAYQLGIDPDKQRPRMNESLGIIKRLFTETKPITYKSEWFELNEAMSQLRPYTKPHMPMYVASVQSPTGMLAAGKYGLGVLSLTVPRQGSQEQTNLKEFWKVGEESAKEHGNKMDRSKWNIVVPVHLAESKKEAMNQVREKSAEYDYDYFHKALGRPWDFDGPRDKIVDHHVNNGTWVVGTPDDLIEYIKMLDELTGGFGGFMIQTTEWATREQVMKSYELIARYVMPHFQNSLQNIQTSYDWAVENSEEIMSRRQGAINKAISEYENK